MSEEEKLNKELTLLRQEHSDLDKMLNTQEETPLDQITLQRLKKRKLWLKDRILEIEAILYPDIIA